MDTPSSDNMTLIGTIDALYGKQQCVGVKVTGVGFKKGATLCFKPDDSGKRDAIITADSIEINHEQVAEVKTGQQCGIKFPVPIERLVEKGTPVYLVTKPVADEPSVQNAGTANKMQDGEKI